MKLLLRTLYFLLIGWWLGILWGLVGYLCCVSLVLLPIGLLMLNRLPQVITLKPVPVEPYTGSAPKEYPFWIRAVWFLFAGWYLSGLLVSAGIVCSLTIVGIPLGLWCFNRIPLVLTLKQAA
ncbi:MAG: YccF domain-containing protein [Deltaproteobacteria bacterium]|nr:YccF domain-containing protein [Deltaproteobacteria bacterium]